MGGGRGGVIGARRWHTHRPSWSILRSHSELIATWQHRTRIVVASTGTVIIAKNKAMPCSLVRRWPSMMIAIVGHQGVGRLLPTSALCQTVKHASLPGLRSRPLESSSLGVWMKQMRQRRWYCGTRMHRPLAAWPGRKTSPDTVLLVRLAWPYMLYAFGTSSRPAMPSAMAPQRQQTTPPQYHMQAGYVRHLDGLTTATRYNDRQRVSKTRHNTSNICRDRHAAPPSLRSCCTLFPSPWTAAASSSCPPFFSSRLAPSIEPPSGPRRYASHFAPATQPVVARC